MDSSPPGSSVPGILQARTLEWVAISFSNAWKWKVKVKLLSRVWICPTSLSDSVLPVVSYQAPPAVGFSRQVYWSGLPFPSPKLWMVIQEMARVNMNILGISELKWTGVVEFNSDDYYIYYCGQESLRKNRVAIIVNKSLKCITWMQSQKWQNELCSFPRQTIQYHSNPSLYPEE